MRASGKFPQVLSHIGLVNAALAIADAKRLLMDRAQTPPRISPSGADCLCPQVVSPNLALASRAAKVEIAPLTFPATDLVTCRQTEIAADSPVALSLTLDPSALGC